MKKKWLILIFFIVFGVIHSSGVYASSLSLIRMDIIKDIESSSGKDKTCYSMNRNYIGLYQVGPDVLKEYNQRNGTRYNKKDLLNDGINYTISKWYLCKRIPEMLRHYKKEVSVRNIIIAYNAGIRYVTRNMKLSKETRDYLTKYAKRGGTI